MMVKSGARRRSIKSRRSFDFLGHGNDDNHGDRKGGYEDSRMPGFLHEWSFFIDGGDMLVFVLDFY